MDTSTTISSRTQAVRAAWTQVLPVVLGYLPIGFAYGILARQSGLSTANTLIMSLLVYAGSAQLIAVGLLGAGVSPISVIITTLIVNLRHLLMSAALAPYLKHWRKALIPLFSFELTDETFGLHSVSFPEHGAPPGQTLLINVIAQSAWVAGTLRGVFAGNLITDVRPFGLDYALAGMFAALLVFQVKTARIALIAALSGALSTFLLLSGASHWNVIIATLVAATCGVLIETWTKKSSS
jgi:4-azaleucine resistance transporter AzlC